MNLKFVKYFGISLISLSVMIILVAMTAQIIDNRALTRGYGKIDYFADVLFEGLGFSVVVFLAGIPTGIFYYRSGKKDEKLQKIPMWALILQLISFGIMIPVSLLLFFSCFNGCDGLGEGLMFLFFGIPALTIYCIGIILLIINRILNKGFILQKQEIFFFLILLGMGFTMGSFLLYALEKSRTLNFDCEKAKNRDWCYTEEASYKEDPKLCENIINLRMKEDCANDFRIIESKNKLYNDPNRTLLNKQKTSYKDN